MAKGLLTSASDWTYSFTDLPKFRAGKAIVYTVTEDSLDNYTPKTNGYDITNSYTPAKTSVSVSKLWDDKDDQDGLRPKSIKVQLYAGENPIGDPVTLDSDNQWATTFSDLDLKAKGQLISYTVKEVDTIKGYTPTINDIDQGNIIITNAHTPELIEVKGTKTWDDKDNQDGLRPDKIIVNLMDGETKVASKEVTSASNWTYSFTDLPKFRAGKAIVYTITENSMDNYKAKVNGFDITNSYTPGKTSVTVTKVWDDRNDQDGLRPKNIQVQLYANDKPSGDPVTLDSDNKWMTTFTDLDLKAKGQLIDYKVKEVDKVSGYQTTIDDSNKGNILITNSHRPNLTTFNGTKTWSDSDNQDGLRPTSITVNLLADGKKVGQQVVTADTKWTYSFTGFPQFAAGKAIKYAVSEEKVVGYDTTINGYDITNSHTPEIIEVNGTKAWNDNNNQDGIRPTSIKVNLLANGKIISFKEVKSTDNWQYKFISLPKFEAGKAIVYTVSE
ncbi:Cna B-type domain-containing protein, partial [Lactococcus carnosus]|uniref:Cna B-type domain-containing protein n=1 Tax=Pseudolactococcus carnosus TaxID=2749961 RepID=UPI003B978C58